MRFFLVVFLVSIGLISSVPVIEQVPAFQVSSKKVTQKPFLVLERSFPCNGTVHKARFFYNQTGPQENFSEDKDFVVLPIKNEAEIALKEFTYPRTRSVLTGEDFTLGEVLLQFITLMDTTVTNFKESKEQAKSVAVKLDFLNMARTTMVVIAFKKEGRKITADIHLRSPQVEAPQDVVNFLQVVLCDDSISSKSAKLLRSPGARRGLMGVLYVGAFGGLVRLLFSSSNRPSSDIITRINAAYPGAYGEFKRFLGTDILWAKHTQNPRIALIILNKGCLVSTLAGKLGSADAAELSGVELYRVLYDDSCDIGRFDAFTRKAEELGLAFPHQITSDLDSQHYFDSKYRYKNWASAERKSKVSWTSGGIFQKKLVEKLKKRFKDLKSRPFYATFTDNDIDFRLFFRSDLDVDDNQLSVEAGVHASSSDLLFLLKKPVVGDDDPIIQSTVYKTWRATSFVFCNASFVIYRDPEKNLIVLIADGKKEEYVGLDAFVDGLVARIVEVVGKSEKPKSPITPGEYLADFDGGAIRENLKRRADSRKKSIQLRSAFEVQEQLEILDFTVEGQPFEQSLKDAGKFYAVLCNLSDFSSEYVQSLKNFIRQTKSGSKKYKIFVIQNDIDPQKLTLLKGIGGVHLVGSHLLPNKDSLANGGIYLLQPDLTGVDGLVTAIEKEFFTRWLSTR